MQCRSQLIIGKSLQQIRNVDDTSTRDGCSWNKLLGVERIDFKAANAVLEEDCTEPEVSVGMNAGVFLRVYGFLCDGHVVKDSELGIRSLHVVVEEGG